MMKQKLLYFAPMFVFLVACSSAENAPPLPGKMEPPPSPQTTCPSDPLEFHFGNAATTIYLDGLSAVSDKDCNLYIAGTASTPINLGLGPIGASASDSKDIYVFIAKFDPTGKTLWSKALPQGTQASGKQILAADASGNLVLGGTLLADADLGGGPLGGDYQGMTHLFLLGLDTDGNHRFSTRIAGTKEIDIGQDEFFGQRVDSLALDADGNILISGTFNGELDLGGKKVVAMPWVDSFDGKTYYFRTDIFAAKYTPAGQLIWGERFGADLSERNSAVTVLPNGNSVLMANLFWNSLDPMPTMPGCYYSCIKEFNPDGILVRELSQGETVDLRGNVSLTALDDGGLIVGAEGGYGQSLGGDVPVSAVVARLDSDWKPVFDTAIAGSNPAATEAFASIASAVPDINDGIRAVGYFKNLLSIHGVLMGGPADGEDSFEVHAEFTVAKNKASVILGGPDSQRALVITRAPMGAKVDEGADYIIGIEGPLRYFPMSDPPEAYAGPGLFIRRIHRP